MGQCLEVVPSSSAKNITKLRLVCIEMRAEPLGLFTGERNLQDLLFLDPSGIFKTKSDRKQKLQCE